MSLPSKLVKIDGWDLIDSIDVEVISDVTQGRLESAYVNCYSRDDTQRIPHGAAIEALNSEGYKVISLKENAFLRINADKNKLREYGALIQKEDEKSDAEEFAIFNPNWVKEGLLYLPNNEVFMIRDCWKLPFHKSPSKRQIEKALADSVKVSREKNWNISVDGFAEDPRALFAYGEYAKPYGELLKESGVEDVCFLTSNAWHNAKNKPLVRQIVSAELAYEAIHAGDIPSDTTRGVRVAA